MKISIPSKRILFLGYGAVAKCVWNYFDDYLTCLRKHVTLVDKNKDAFYGPNIKGIRKLILDVNATNIDDLVDSLRMKEGDVIIDLTSSSATYYFIKLCFRRGFHYINTSIEDTNDAMLGTSIDCQQKTVRDIAYAERHAIRSTILTECGQNPGLIQHYVLYALQQLSGVKIVKNAAEKKRILKKVIKDHKIGSILMSEIDNMKTNKPIEKPLIYNTWSAVGFLVEALDKTEVVGGGTNNSFIKPVIPTTEWNNTSMDIHQNIMTNHPYKVLFLNKSALQTTLNSICPILNEKGQIEFTNYRGRLIHHGEVFELARYFGKDAPFMSYVYKNSPYMDESIRRFYTISKEVDDLWLYIHQDNSCHVFDNIKRKDDSDTFQLHGHDSIGCTLFCGEEKVDHIYWCGSILSDKDHIDPNFTPTVVQVTAGVLSGLSYILEEKNSALGWIEPIDIDTDYMLEKSIPLLGKFFFTEIPVEAFSGSFDYSTIM